MNQSLTLRMIVAAAMIGLAGYFLVPTVVYFSLSEQQLNDVRSDPAAFKKLVPEWAPTTHIIPGLDLQGGIHMVVGVDLEKAVADRARRTTQRMRSVLNEEKIQFKTIDHLPELGIGDRLEVDFKDSTQVERYLKDVADKQFGDLATESQDGTKLTLRVHPDYVTKLKKEAIGQVKKTLENRISDLGVTEPSISKRGDDQIQIQLPGFNDPEAAKNMIGRTAQLEFMMCNDEIDFLSKLTDLPPGVSYVASAYGRPDGSSGKDLFLSFPENQKDTVKKYLADKTPSGNIIRFGKMRARKDLDQRMRTFTLYSMVELTGDDLTDANVILGTVNDPNPSVSLEFSKAGGNIFEELSGDNIGKRMGIVLEENVDSAPVFQVKISGGRASISMGSGTQTEMKKSARELTMVLKSGALPAPIQFREERTVGPSLGADAVEAGKKAFAVGALLIVLFILFYYRLCGLFSIMGITVNMLFVLATLSWFNMDVTLPGLAGLLLTIGMAVDANIIVNERIREELKAGKRALAAIHAGYEHALSAILDANITTFIAGVVLMQYGTGPVQNFAKLLLIGTVSSVVSAIFITRIFFDLGAKNDPETLSI
ncbi:MAG: protein translocase subunit SecD [Deltaproteobacteria bacterium]|nr:protein translocase subunit SecD [Deltaproteobacteria bacterium]